MISRAKWWGEKAGSLAKKKRKQKQIHEGGIIKNDYQPRKSKRRGKNH
jgi:hypothetical protein